MMLSIVGNSDTHTRKARLQGLVGAFAPAHRTPRRSRQRQGEALDALRGLLRVLAPARRHASFPRPRLRRQGALPRSPDFARMLYLYGVAQSQLGNALPERILGAVGAVGKHRLDSDSHALLAGPGELLQSNLWLGGEAHFRRHLGSLA